MSIEEQHPRGASARIDLVERDLRDHAKSLSDIVNTLGKGFSQAQMDQLRVAFREELADAGLRIDGPDHVDDAREDFRFLRRMRRAWDGSAKKIGNAVLAALIVIASAITATGFWTWINSGGKPPT